MGVKVGVGAVWVLVVVMVGVVTSAPPTPDVSKRSAEDIQFGNQQNLPIGLLDDNAQPGAFPSSETSEEAVEEKEAMKKEETEPKKEEVKGEEKKEEDESKEKGTQVKEEEEEEEERRRRNGGGGVGGGGVMDESRWHNSAVPSLRYYRPHWGVPRLYSPSSLPLHRRRRSLASPTAATTPAAESPSLPGRAANPDASQGEAGEEDDQRRQKRDADLDQLLKEVDVMELLNLLTHPRQQAPAPQPPRHLYPRPGTGFGTVRYAPAPPRFAPQPKLFPDYEEGEGAKGVRWGAWGS